MQRHARTRAQMRPQRPIAFDALHIGDAEPSSTPRLTDSPISATSRSRIGQHRRHPRRKYHRAQRKSRQAVAGHIALAAQVTLQKLRGLQIDQQSVHGGLRHVHRRNQFGEGQSAVGGDQMLQQRKALLQGRRAGRAEFSDSPAPSRQSLRRAAFVPVSKLASRRSPFWWPMEPGRRRPPRRSDHRYNKKRDRNISKNNCLCRKSSSFRRSKVGFPAERGSACAYCQGDYRDIGRAGDHRHGVACRAADRGRRCAAGLGLHRIWLDIMRR